MAYEIIDFHTHPFWDSDQNLCDFYPEMPRDEFANSLAYAGISRFCGSVIRVSKSEEDAKRLAQWETLRKWNDDALRLRELFGERYIPGFHVHPNFVRESCDEIERLAKLGHRLIGELVPYINGWDSYACKGFDEILDCAEAHDMIVSFHSMSVESIDNMVDRHKGVTLVAAHPLNQQGLDGHIARMKRSDHYHIDISGMGFLPMGLLRYGIDRAGVERFLFGSDHPGYHTGSFIGGIERDSLLTDDERRMIFSENAKRLLRL